MEIYHKTGDFLVCGYLNGSPLEIIVPELMTEVYRNEVYHYHPYHEYYIILQGRARLKVEGREAPMEAGTIIMVAPGERHRVTWVDPDMGVKWIVVKERSAPDTKILAPEEE